MKTKVWRKILTTLVASLYSLVVTLHPYSFLNGVLFQLILSAVMAMIMYFPQNKSELIKAIITLHVVTYFFGGVISSIIHKVGNQYAAVVISAIICSLLIALVKEILKRKVDRENLYCNIKIYINGKMILAKAFLDTGNELCDNVTGDTVIITTEEVIEKISEDLLKVLNGIMIEIPDEYQTKIRMISYSTIGDMDDVLYGIKADKVIVYYDGKEIENKDTVVALSHNHFQNFDALIGMHLIEGGYVIGNSFVIKNEGKKIMG